MSALVSCYSGYTFADRPVSFSWGECVCRVQSVVREWREPGVRCFRVRTEANGIFDVCYNENRCAWSVERAGGKERVQE